jgi:hypothetical protein
MNGELNAVVECYPSSSELAANAPATVHVSMGFGPSVSAIDDVAPLFTAPARGASRAEEPIVFLSICLFTNATTATLGETP